MTSNRSLRSAALLIGALFIALSAVIVYYFVFYIPAQEHYFTEHSFRDLAVASERIEAAIANYARMTSGNATKKDGPTTPNDLAAAFALADPLKYVGAEGRSPQDSDGCSVTSTALAAPLSVRVELDPAASSRASSAIETNREVQEGSVHRMGATLYFRYRCRKEMTDGYCGQYVRSTEEANGHQQQDSDQRAIVCSKISLDDLFTPLVRGDVFDVLDPLLIKDDGTVLYQRTGGGLRIERFPNTGAGSSKGSAPAGSKADDKNTSAADTADTLPPVDLMIGATFEKDINPAGIAYRLYTQPLHLKIPVDSGNGPAVIGGSNPWVIGGLVKAEDLRREAVPIRLLYALPGLLLMGALGVPLLKLWAIGPRERLRARDVAYLSLSILLASGLLTVALLDWYAYAWVERQADESMRQYTEELVKDFRSELQCATAALKRFTADHTARIDGSSRSKGCSAMQTAIFNTPDSCYQDTKHALREAYPFLDMLSWADKEGQQVEKWAIKDATPAMMSIKRWASFNNPKQGYLATVDFSKDVTPNAACSAVTRERLSLSLFVSPNTGETLSVLSIPIDAEAEGARDTEVATLATPFVSFIDPITPPDLGFAVIQESGRVVFHSNSSLNLNENFFDESERTKLLAPMSARHADFVDVAYHGHPHRAYVHPLPDMPWSVIVFHDDTLLSTVNLEIVASAVLAFGILPLGALLGIILVRLFWPDDRWDWCWPDSRRRNVYLRGTWVLTAVAAWLLWAMAKYSSAAVATAVFAVPLAAASYCFLLLTNGVDLAPIRRRFAYLTCALTTLLLLAISILQAWSSALNLPAAIILVVTIVSGGWVLSRSTPDPGDPAAHRRAGQPFVAAGQPFVAMACVFLLVVAVLPAAALFANGWGEGMKALVQYHQLVFGYDLAHRSQNAYERYVKIDPDLVRRRLYDQDWDVPAPTSALFSLKLLGCGDSLAGNDWQCLEGDESKEPHPFLRTVIAGLRTVSLEGTQLQEMLDDEAHDCRWKSVADHASPKRRTLRLWDDRLEHDPVASRPCGDHTYRGLYISAEVPSFPLPETRVGAVAAFVFVLLSFWGVFLFLRALMNRILGLQVDSDAAVSDTAVAAARGCLLLQPGGSVAAGLNQLKPCAYPIDLYRVDESVEWNDLVTEAKAKPCVLVEHLEHRIDDAKWNRAKLELLEGLVLREGLRVFVTSDIDLVGYFARRLRSPSDPATEENYVTAEELHRWARVMGCLSKVRSEMPQHGSEPVNHLEKVLRDECQWTPRLRGIETEIRAEAHWEWLSTHELRRHIGDLADAHYRTLWALCTDEERLVLVQLAREGFINPKCWPVVRRLMRRRLIARRPAFRVMNRSFARFALEAEPEKVTGWEQAEGASLWQTLRSGLFLLVIVAALFIFMTQPAVLNSYLALLPALAGALGALGQLFGFFRSSGTPSGSNA